MATCWKKAKSVWAYFGLNNFIICFAWQKQGLATLSGMDHIALAVTNQTSWPTHTAALKITWFSLFYYKRPAPAQCFEYQWRSSVLILQQRRSIDVTARSLLLIFAWLWTSVTCFITTLKTATQISTWKHFPLMSKTFQISASDLKAAAVHYYWWDVGTYSMLAHIFLVFWDSKEPACVTCRLLQQALFQ